MAVSKDLGGGSSPSPLDASPEAALDALRLAAGQRMEARMGDEGGARGFVGVKRLVASLTDSLVAAKARLSDMSARLEQAEAAAAAATARAEAAEATEAATAAELQQNVRVPRPWYPQTGRTLPRPYVLWLYRVGAGRGARRAAGGSARGGGAGGRARRCARADAGPTQVHRERDEGGRGRGSPDPNPKALALALRLAPKPSPQP